MAIYNFGSINIDHIYSVDHFVEPGETLSSNQYDQVLGGKGANQSIACAMAGQKVYHIGIINQADANYIEMLKQAGVNVSFILKSEKTASGHAIIQVNQQGENAIVLYAGANHALTKEHIESVLSQATSNDWVLLQNETNLVSEIIELAHERKINVAFNPAPIKSNVFECSLDKVNLLFVNEIEAMQLTRTHDIASARLTLKKDFPNTKVIMTLGKAGAAYLYQNEVIDVAGKQVKALDTTAAGDTFTGFFLANYSANGDILTALEFANAAAALCVTKHGASPSIPCTNEVMAFLNS